jgi:hypothetical protein
MKTFVACFLAFAATGVAPVTVDYRFDDVRRSVTLTSGTEQKKVDKGATAHGGDKVDTGYFSYALIAAEHYHAKFEIFSSTKVKLASETPGVILSLERGKLRAVFDKITGSEPRIVQTPGALLAVRGTQYDVEVDNSGNTTLDVWEGTVELTSPQLREPRFVHAGEESQFGRNAPPPPPHPIPDARRGNDPTQKPRDGQQPPNNVPRTPPQQGGRGPGQPPPGAVPGTPPPRPPTHH